MIKNKHKYYREMSEGEENLLEQNYSNTSLDAEMEDAFEPNGEYNQYIKMLKNNNQVISLALHKAEDLIREYKSDNEYLKSRNTHLEGELAEINDEVEYLKDIIFNNQNQQALGYKIKELKVKNEENQRYMNSLKEELEKSESKVRKLTKSKQIAVEKNMQNFFQFGVPSKFEDQSVNYEEKEKQYCREVRSLKWKIQQLEDEITYLIKLNRSYEDKVNQDGCTNKNHKMFCQTCREGSSFESKTKKNERFVTCSTEPNQKQADQERNASHNKFQFLHS